MRGEGPDDGGGNATGAEYPWTPSVLIRIRNRRRFRVTALLVAAVIGLGLAWAHWLGLFVAGALLGLVSGTPGRAVLSGLAFGVLVLVVQVLLVSGMDVGEFLALRPPVYVTVGAGIGAPIWGALIRGVL